jgi:hypothetical protein
MSSIWNWLDGNKTLIGSIILNIAQFIPEGTEVTGIPVNSILYWLGGVLSGGGLAHKTAKVMNNKKISPSA